MELTIAHRARYIYPPSIAISAADILYSKRLIDAIGITTEQRAIFATDEQGDWYVSFSTDNTVGIPIIERENNYHYGKNGQVWKQHQLRSHNRNLSRQILSSINAACISATLLVSTKPIYFNERNWYKFTTKRPFKVKEF